MRLSSPSKQKQSDENQGLRTERQIRLHRKREQARREEAKRREADAWAREADARAREAEARVRHLNFELIQRIVLLIMGVSIGIALIVGVMCNPALLKISLAAASIWGAIAAALYRWKPQETSTAD